MTDTIKFLAVMYGGMIAFVLMLLLLDWLGRRQERHRARRS